MLDIDPIKARLAAATPGPWSSCSDDGCKCANVVSRHHPICHIVSGEWGDEYPAMRMVGTSLDQTYEAYIERIAYGNVPEAEALANRAFIRESWADVKALLEEVERLRAL